MKGKKAINCYSLKSYYDNDSFAVITTEKQKLIDENGKEFIQDYTEYRIKGVEVLKLIKKHEFNLKKARKWTYLEVSGND